MKNNSPHAPQATVLFLHGDFASFIYSPERFCAYTKCLCMYYGMLHLCVRMSIHRCIDLLFKMRLLYRSLVCVNCSLRPVGCSPPGFPVHGIFQARLLEWVAILFSRGSFWPRDWTLYCRSPVLQTDSLASEPPEKPKHRPSFFKKNGKLCFVIPFLCQLHSLQCLLWLRSCGDLTNPLLINIEVKLGFEVSFSLYPILSSSRGGCFKLFLAPLWGHSLLSRTS